MNTIPSSRREFLRRSALAAGALAGSSILATRIRAGIPERLRVGLIGCGGRGSGAAVNALMADKNAVLTALGDAFSDSLERTFISLKKSEEIGERVQVSAENRFAGLDAYEKVIQSGVDVVLLATPPGFRPLHLKAAIAAGKHVFCEKPVAVDAAGVRSVLESAAEAKRRNLSLISGFCYRYSEGTRAWMEQIHNGAIGDIRVIHTSYNAGPVWVKARKPEWTDAEYQMRNWYYFNWLSGDHIVEQAVHNLDKMSWMLGDKPPLHCTALGGRQARTGPEFGHIFDHFSVVFEYPGNVRAFHSARQQANTVSDNSDHAFGTDGVARIVRSFTGPYVVQGKTNWEFKGAKLPDMYQQEHNELFSSIHSGKPINDGEQMAHSTLLAIMARQAAYTGQLIPWDEAMQSKENTFPEQLTFQSQIPVPAVAVPGVTKFI